VAEAQIQQDAVASPGIETRSRRQDFLRAFFSNRLAIFGAAIMSVFILMAVFAPYVAPYSPLQQHLPQKFEGPTLAHPFGPGPPPQEIAASVGFVNSR
jgi:peptide/nickel transport system permease protein